MTTMDKIIWAEAKTEGYSIIKMIQTTNKRDHKKEEIKTCGFCIYYLKELLLDGKYFRISSLLI